MSADDNHQRLMDAKVPSWIRIADINMGATLSVRPSMIGVVLAAPELDLD